MTGHKAATDRAHILFVVDGLEYGGGERVFLQLALGLRDRYHVSVASTPGGICERRFRDCGVTFHRVDMHRRFSLKPIRRIRKIIVDHGIDVVHSQGARADFFARAAARLAGHTPVVCTVATLVEGFHRGPFIRHIYRLCDRLTERYVGRFICVSHALRRYLTEGRTIPPGRVVTIHNGIEVDHYRPVHDQSFFKSAWGISPDVSLVGAVGRLVEEKGFRYFIEAASLIEDLVPGTMFLLAGTGPLRGELEDMARRLGIAEKVIFAGFTHDIRDVMAAVDVLIMPSLTEGFPMTTLEAMALSRPVIASDIDGIREQIQDGIEGILVPPEDPVALAQAVAGLLQDGNLSRMMGRAARQRVEGDFSVERMVSETERVYRSLMKET